MFQMTAIYTTRERTLKKTLVYLLLFFCITACATSNKNRHDEIVNNEASRLTPPETALSAYSDFKLENMEFSAEILQREEKIKVGHMLEDKIRARLLPLLQEWNTGNGQNKGTLLIKPQLQQLHVVSGGARFWIGALAGDSRIDMDLLLIDAQTGNKIANPRIITSANAWGGAWSIGSTDRNLLNYIADITHKYLTDNYKR